MSGWVELLWYGKREKPFTKESVDEHYGGVREVKKSLWKSKKLSFLA